MARKPHRFTQADFSGAQAAAVVFLVVAGIVLLGGVYLTIGYIQDHEGRRTEIVAVITILSSASFAFFGYVLQILLAIHFAQRDRELRSSSSPPGLSS